MKRLIINADDLGLTEGVNRGIIEAHQRGLLTSTSLMANGEAFDDALARLLQAPQLSVGVHVNLTAGRPLTDAPSLVDAAGNFYPLPKQAMRLSLGAGSRRELYREVVAQVDKIAAAGVTISHFDSHHNLHLHPLILAAVSKVAREAGVNWVRFVRQRPFLPEGLSEAGLLSLTDRALQAAAMVGYGAALMGAKTGAARRFIMGAPVLPNASARQLLGALLAALPDGITEWACHPGYCDDLLRSMAPFKYAERREEELRILIDPASRSLVEQAQAQLISYRDLAG